MLSSRIKTRVDFGMIYFQNILNCTQRELDPTGMKHLVYRVTLALEIRITNDTSKDSLDHGECLRRIYF